MNIYRIPNLITTENSYLLEEAGNVLIIDPGDFTQIRDFLRQSDFRPEQVLLTHEHFDHIEGLEELRRIYHLPVMASSVCGSRITDPRLNLSVVYDLCVFQMSGYISPDRHQPFSCSHADRGFSGSCSLSFHGHSLHLTECPGHSPGSILIRVDDSCYFTGDYMISHTEPNLSLYGSSRIDYVRRALPLLREIPAGSMLYPGHGEPYTLSGASQL
ncbi:MAG: MBL fold metallo-hydrolase [Bilifractor sp.]